jgi:hypothetical protein
MTVPVLVSRSFEWQYVEWFRSNEYIIRNNEGKIILRRASTPHRIEVQEDAPPIAVFAWV